MEHFPEYWKTIVDTMMDGVVVVDREGVILSVNKALERITGYHGSELVGQECRILDCDTCFSRDGGSEPVKKCRLFEVGSVVKLRCRLTRKDGLPLHALKNGAILRGADGTVVGGVETLTDITDLVTKERTIQELKDLLSPGDGFEGIIGKGPGMLDVYALIRNAALSDAPIIIYGESGTGKELAANAIHRQGKRKKGPFVKVNCAALAESLLESELFGHVRGAFTGADRDRRGRFESAHRGDLFLDEIGDIPLPTQAKLLRVLQEKEVERVGDHRPIPIDTRIITATHRDIGEMCREGRFRDDLFYRLNVIPIHMPPLRERREDIPLLVDHFIRTIRVRSDKEIHGVSDEAMERLSLYHWPGNVRELINVLEYAFVVCQEPVISARHLPVLAGSETRPGQHHRRKDLTQEKQKEMVVRALEEAGGNRENAARLLGISRVTLWKLLKKHGIKPHTRFEA
ncbi:MAG TPA: sigma 54-interacting transcriptional regulator [Syntrophorhabdaceae bacterium]|jgi:PAS domain S-box-containing protein